MSYFNLEISENNFLPAIIQQPEIIEVEAEVIHDNYSIGWEVVERPIFDTNGNIIEGFKQLVRNDNGFCLNVCNDGYKPTPNALFMECINFISSATGMDIHKIEELRGGKILLAYLWNAEPLTICGHKFNNYMVIGNSHNYQSTFFIGEHSTMTRCQNQFARCGKDLKAYHTTGHEQRVKQLIAYYDKFKTLQRNTIEFMQRLENIKIDNNITNQLFNMLLEIKPNTDFSLLSTRKQNILTALNESVQRETLALGQNAFGLFNGVTHWTTHARREKEKVYSQFFGSSANLNNKAMQFCNYLINL